MIITVGGSVGSGKSTLARKLAERYDIPYYSVGSIMRNLAKEKKISLLELSASAEKDSSVDKELDCKQKDIVAKESGGCVMDSRLGAHILKADFKIWLDASPEVKAQRISGRDGISLKEAREHIKRREASERKRYMDFYGIDLTDMSVYDLIIKTDSNTPDETLQQCIAAIDVKKL